MKHHATIWPRPLRLLCFLLPTVLCTALWGCADEADTDNLVLSSEQITVDTRDISLSPQGGSKTVNVNANCRWLLSSTDGWLGFSIAYGQGNGSFTVTADANSSITTPRTATIVIITDGGLQRTISVVQEKAEETLAFSAEQLTFAAAGEMKTLTIRSNTTWKLQGAEDWLMLTATEGQGNWDITIVAQPNPGETARQAVLTLQGTTRTASITITQEGEKRAITPNVTSLTMEPKASTKTLLLEGNAAWTVSSSEEWLTLSPLSGTGTTTIEVTVTDNFSSKPRTAQITITATTSGATQTVSVMQTGSAEPIVGGLAVVSSGRNSITLTAHAMSYFDLRDYGFVCSATRPTPDVGDQRVQATGIDSQGNFTATLTGLESGTTYYVRAYAINPIGTTYTPAQQVTTEGGKPTDDDNPRPNI